MERLGHDDDRVVLKEEGESCTTENPQSDPFTYSRATRFRLCTRHLLDTYKYQVVVVSLVIFNCVLVITELLFDIQAAEQRRDAGLLSDILSTISLSIICLFMVEVAVKTYAYGVSYFQRKFEIFDALVVFVAFGLNLSVHNPGFGLIIVFRLWRVVKILNGVVMSVKTQSERSLARERRVRESLEVELTKLRRRCTVQERQLDTLKGILARSGISVSELSKTEDDQVQDGESNARIG